MKTFHRDSLFLLAIMCVVMFGFASSSQARHRRWIGTGTGELIITRAPDLGNFAYVAVKIDGVTTTGIIYAQKYVGSLPAGRHIIQVRLAPTYYTYSPSWLTLNVEPGQRYAFMAEKRGGALVLAAY